MKRIRLVFITLILAASSGSAFAQTGSPADAVKSFYAFNRTHSTKFTRLTVDKRKPWFSEALYKLFLNELKREKEFVRQHPNEKTYFAEGLPFVPIDETCKVGRRELHKKLSVIPDTEDNSVATVNAVFEFPSPCKSPDKTVYTIELIRAGSRWLIDNVIYEQNSNLVEDLKRKDY